jgi:hypothetical protein
MSTVQYGITPSIKLAYVKFWGHLTIEDLLVKGNSFLNDEDWENGFDILLDYREVTQLDVYGKDVQKIVANDMMNEHFFDKSRCAVVAEKDFVYGLARMWEAFSEQTKIKSKLFKDMDNALDWLGLSPKDLNSVKFHP